MGGPSGAHDLRRVASTGCLAANEDFAQGCGERCTVRESDVEAIRGDSLSTSQHVGWHQVAKESSRMSVLRFTVVIREVQ